MRFVVGSKSEDLTYYTIELENRERESRYFLVGTSTVRVHKDAKFGSGLPTPEEDNRRWFDSIEVGSEFVLKPVEPSGKVVR